MSVDICQHWDRPQIQLHETIDVLLELGDPEALAAYRYAGRMPPVGAYWYSSAGHYLYPSRSQVDHMHIDYR